MSDDSIVKSIQNGNKDAFGHLYNKYAKFFKHIAMRYSTDHAEAEDYAQEAMVRIYKNIGSYKFQGSFEGWMKRVLINHCLNGVKKRNVLKNRIDITEMPDSSGGVIGDASHEINKGDILTAIDELPAGYNKVLNMYVIEGFSHKEIGQELNITESSSRSQLTKARSKLKGILMSRGLVSQDELRFAT